MEEFDTSDAGAHPNWPDRFFARLVDTYLAHTGNRGGRVGDAQSFLIGSAGLLEFASGFMKAVAADLARLASCTRSWRSETASSAHGSSESYRLHCPLRGTLCRCSQSRSPIVIRK